MAYNRWRNGSPNRAYKAVWLPSQKHELYHYGVIGMKWGVRKIRKYEAQNAKALKNGTGITMKKPDGSSQAFDKKGVSYGYKANQERAKLDAKATKKLKKLNAKYEKRQARADRKFDKAERKSNSFLASERSARKAFRKASKEQFKANKIAAKGKKWYDQMSKEYKKAGISMTKENQEIGKELIRQVRANSRAMYAANYVRG